MFWELYAEICELQGDDIEAGSAYERATRWHHAATCYRRADEVHDAARCLIEGGMEAEAASLLLEQGDAFSATLFEVAIRASIDRLHGVPLSPEMATAVGRCVQLLVENEEVESIGGHLDTRHPLAFNERLVAKPTEPEQDRP